MLISIIVPIYNIEQYIGKCIESIQNQTYKKFEVILVDDGSTDSSPEICDKFANEDSRFHVLHKRNGGSNSARVAGLLNSSGSHIIFVDGDDWIENNCLERLVDCLSENEMLDLVCYGAKSIYQKQIVENKSSIYPGLYKKDRIEKDIFPFLIANERGKYFSASVWGKVFRRSLLEECYKFVDLRITMGEDSAVTKPYIFKCNSIYILDECLYCYNQLNMTSMTHSLKPIDWENVKLIRNVLINCFGNSENWLSQIDRSTVHSLFTTSISWFSSDKSYIAVAKMIKDNLSDYDDVFRRCQYTSRTFKIINIILRYRFVLILYLYGRLIRPLIHDYRYLCKFNFSNKA